jgi:transposase
MEQIAYRRYVGVDIAAMSATAVWVEADQSVSPVYTFAQTAEAYTRLQQRLVADDQHPAQVLVVLEATGSYWMRLATSLARAGFAVSVINPAQAHHFARALLKQAKTDAIDAHTLAHLAAVLRPTPWTPPPAIYTELEQRLTQRDSLLHLRQQVANQLHALVQQPVVIAAVQSRMEQLLTTFDAQLAELTSELEAALKQDDAWAAAYQRLRTIPGVGLVTAVALLVTTLAFSTCPTPEAAAAYAGLAPQPRLSGTSLRGRARLVQTGNARLRTALYLATLSAARHNPTIRPFYERLRAAGKPPKVARCAAARKLLHIAWAVVKKQRDFDPSFASASVPCKIGA